MSNLLQDALLTHQNNSLILKGLWLCLRLFARLTCYARFKRFPDYGRPFPLLGAWGWRPGSKAFWYIGPTGLTIAMIAKVARLTPPWHFWALTADEAQKWMDEELLRHWERHGHLAACWLHPMVYNVLTHAQNHLPPIDPERGPWYTS